MPTETKFDSEGFDLGSSNNNNEAASEVIYEIGGGGDTNSTTAPPVKKKDEEEQQHKSEESERPIAESERLKELGNNEFRQQIISMHMIITRMLLRRVPWGRGWDSRGRSW